jgi:hypothetical protein
MDHQTLGGVGAIDRILDPVQDTLVVRIAGADKNLGADPVIYAQRPDQQPAIYALERLCARGFKITQPFLIGYRRYIYLKAFSRTTGMAVDTLDGASIREREGLGEDRIDALLVIVDAQRTAGISGQGHALAATARQEADTHCRQRIE